MNINKIIIPLTIIVCLIIVAVPTFIKVVNTNHENLHKVTDKKIIEAAEKCYYEKKCNETNITLNELYEKGYLEENIIDPVSKEVYTWASYVSISKEGSTFNIM